MATKGELAVGVDLGGTKMITALVDPEGRVLREERLPTGAGRDPDRVVQAIADSAGRTMAEAPNPPAAIGVGVAAQVDFEGRIRFAPNLQWRDVALRSELEAALGLPVRVLNDVRAATVGEWRFGAGRGEDDLVCLFIGTGLGGGVVSGGHLLVGHSNAAAELGHLTIVAGGRRCTCSNRGCLEAYVAGWAIAERVREIARAEPEVAQRLESLAATPLDRMGAETVVAMAGRGDPTCQRLLGETREFLAAGLVGIANAFNPRLIVAGGGVVTGTGALFEDALEMARGRILPSVAEPLRSARSTLGEPAVAVGAAAWARGEVA